MKSTGTTGKSKPAGKHSGVNADQGGKSDGSRTAGGATGAGAKVGGKPKKPPQAKYDAATDPTRKPPKGWLGVPEDATWNVVFERGDHVELATTLVTTLDALGRQILVADEGEVYGYSPATGLYEVVPEWYLSQIVQAYAGQRVIKIKDGKEVQVPLKVAAGSVTGALKLLFARKAYPEFFCKAQAGIAFADCFAEVTKDGITAVPLSPEHRARQAYPFALPQASETPTRFLQFLDDILLGDADKPQKVAALQEHFGASLAGIATTYERAVLLLGPGDNGRSRYIRVISEAMPPGSVSGVQPALWGDQYVLPRLVGARLNVVGDLVEGEIGGVVKPVISGELRTARDVGRRSVEFRPRAGHLFGAQFLPETTDTSPGFFRRWLIIRLNRSFTGDPTRDPLIVESILPAELPQIVRWGLEGAVRLQAQREYTLPPSHHIVLDAWRRDKQPVKRFIELCTVPAGPKSKGTKATELFTAYCAWIAGLKFEINMTANEFGRRMSQLDLHAKKQGDGNYYPVTLKDGAKALMTGGSQ